MDISNLSQVINNHDLAMIVSNQLNMFIESNDTSYLYSILDETYHVGSQAKKGNNSDLEHQVRLNLKQNSSNFKDPQTALSHRKSNFYKNVILSINSHIGKIQTDKNKEEQKSGKTDRFDKRMGILDKRLSSRQSPIFSSGQNFLDGNHQLGHEFDNTTYGKLMRQISTDINRDIPKGFGGKPNSVDIYTFNKTLRDENIDYDKLLSDDTKKELLKFEKDLRMTKKYHKPGSTELQAQSIANTVNGGNSTPEDNNNQNTTRRKQVETVTKMTEKVKQEAEKAPKSWIGKKISALRNLYSEWLAKKNRERDQGKIGFFEGILRIIASCIDWLLEKLQNFAG